MSPKVVCLFVFVVLINFVASNPTTSHSNYIEQENSCREVCEVCNCSGFYCEEECICECQIEDKENLQCIADMKKVCDKNGLEYEILVNDESDKERFSRQIDANTFADLTKNFAIMKTKREPQSNRPDPVVKAAEPKPSPAEEEDSRLGAAAPEEKDEADNDSIVGSPLKVSAKAASIAGAKVFAGLGNLNTNKLMFTLPNLRNSFPTVAPPAKRVFPGLSLPAPATARTPAPTPTRPPLPTQPKWLLFDD